MKANEIVAAYRARLEERKVTLAERGREFLGAGADARVAWATFAELASVPAYEPFVDAYGDTAHVDQAFDGDLLLFESSLEGTDTLVGEFTRQFTFLDGEGEYLGMNGLTLAVQAEPDAALAGHAGVQVWGCGGPPFTDAEWARREEPPRPFRAAAEWREEVERLAAFRALLLDQPPVRFAVTAIAA